MRSSKLNRWEGSDSAYGWASVEGRDAYAERDGSFQVAWLGRSSQIVCRVLRSRMSVRGAFRMYLAVGDDSAEQVVRDRARAKQERRCRLSETKSD